MKNYFIKSIYHGAATSITWAQDSNTQETVATNNWQKRSPKFSKLKQCKHFHQSLPSKKSITHTEKPAPLQKTQSSQITEKQHISQHQTL